MEIIKKFREVLAIGILILFSLTIPVSAGTLSIGNFSVAPGGTVTGSLNANGVINLASATVNLTYDPLVVFVTEVSRGSGNTLDTLNFNINNTKGQVTLVADNAFGKSGDVVIANITFQAVGSAGSSCPLNIGINELIDINYQNIPATTANGSFIIARGGTATPTPVATSSANPYSPVSSGSNKDISTNTEESRLLPTTPPPASEPPLNQNSTQTALGDHVLAIESTPPASTLSSSTVPVIATSPITTFAITVLLAWLALVLIKKKQS